MPGIDNFHTLLKAASPGDWKCGKDAWKHYHALLSEIGTHLGIQKHTVFAVFSALSPNNDYHGNLRDARRLLQAQVNGKKISEFTVSTYGANKRKAWRIANGADPLKEIQGLKTRNFYLNILNPKDPNPVTIDGHIFNAWRNKRVPISGGGVKMNDRLYYQIAYDIHTLATEFDVLANVIQSTIWFTWKRQHSILTDGQEYFWSRDHLAAGLGYKLERSIKNDTSDCR